MLIDLVVEDPPKKNKNILLSILLETVEIKFLPSLTKPLKE